MWINRKTATQNRRTKRAVTSKTNEDVIAWIIAVAIIATEATTNATTG
jgi:hypothetical protein